MKHMEFINRKTEYKSSNSVMEMVLTVMMMRLQSSVLHNRQDITIPMLSVTIPPAVMKQLEATVKSKQNINSNTFFANPSSCDDDDIKVLNDHWEENEPTMCNDNNQT